MKRSGLPSFKLLIVGALGAGALAYGQGGLDSLGRHLRGEPPRQAERLTSESKKREVQAALPHKMTAPERRPQADRRFTPGNPPRPSAIITGALPRDRTPMPPKRPSQPVAQVGTGQAQPVRRPQEGNCQCPYDLMLDGSACGARSAYLTPGRAKPLCYR